jgi:hypothetical protein
VIAVGDSRAQESSMETSETSPCHTSNDYLSACRWRIRNFFGFPKAVCG